MEGLKDGWLFDPDLEVLEYDTDEPLQRQGRQTDQQVFDAFIDFFKAILAFGVVKRDCVQVLVDLLDCECVGLLAAVF